MTSAFQCEYCQCFTFKRCDKFKVKCTTHGGMYSAHYSDNATPVKNLFKEKSSHPYKLFPDYSISPSYLRAHDCKYRESLARLKKSKILIICQKNPFGELSSKKIFSTLKNL